MEFANKTLYYSHFVAIACMLDILATYEVIITC